MRVKYHRNFIRDYKKADEKVKSAFDNRVNIFVENPFTDTLRNHPLRGRWSGYRSINVTGDFRAIYRVEKETVVFAALGTHSQLYR